MEKLFKVAAIVAIIQGVFFILQGFGGICDADVCGYNVGLFAEGIVYIGLAIATFNRRQSAILALNFFAALEVLVSVYTYGFPMSMFRILMLGIYAAGLASTWKNYFIFFELKSIQWKHLLLGLGALLTINMLLGFVFGYTGMIVNGVGVSTFAHYLFIGCGLVVAIGVFSWVTLKTRPWSLEHILILGLMGVPVSLLDSQFSPQTLLQTALANILFSWTSVVLTYLLFLGYDWLTKSPRHAEPITGSTGVS